MSDRKDVAVIGGGPAGYIAAIRAAQLGGSVILFERDTVGGTCLNRGCIPTKSYLKTTEYLHHIHSAKDRGIIIADASVCVDMGKVVSYKDRVVKVLTSGVASLLKSNGIEVVKGAASLLSPTEIACNGELYAADKIILCGGSKAGTPAIRGIAHPAVLTSDELLELKELPQALCIIGGGVIGCEMACAFRSFGSKVTIIELADRILPTMDAEISDAMKKSLGKLGVKILTGQQVDGIAGPENAPVVTATGGECPCSKVLLSIGRVADLSCLGVLKEEIKTERGCVAVDDEMRTNISNIFACGDIAGKVMLAHAAFKMGETAAENCLGGHIKCNLDYVPGCVYTIPEAASVGLTEAQAVTDLGADLVAVGRFPFSANGRATASGERIGFIKVVTEKATGKLLGAQIFGEMATELIAEPAALIAAGITARQVYKSIIHGHPTYSEAFMEACADAEGQCMHLPKK